MNPETEPVHIPSDDESQSPVKKPSKPVAVFAESKSTDAQPDALLPQPIVEDAQLDSTSPYFQAKATSTTTKSTASSSSSDNNDAVAAQMTQTEAIVVPDPSPAPLSSSSKKKKTKRTIPLDPSSPAAPAEEAPPASDDDISYIKSTEVGSTKKSRDTPQPSPIPHLQLEVESAPRSPERPSRRSSPMRSRRKWNKDGTVVDSQEGLQDIQDIQAL